MPLYVSESEENLIARITFDRPVAEQPMKRRFNFAWLWKLVLG